MNLTSSVIRPNLISAAARIGRLGVVAAFACLAIASLQPSWAAPVCLESGGPYICSKPSIISDWHYGEGECAAPYLWRSAVWCQVRGGTWDPTPINGPVCVNPAPFTATNLAVLAENFEMLSYTPCQMNMTDTDWASHVMPGGMCESWETRLDGVLMSQPREFHFTGRTLDGNNNCTVPWEESVVAQRIRSVTCPKGMQSANDDQKGWVCVKMPPCKACKGNPVDVDTGAKLQREADYASGAAGGLGFERYYNSQGFFSREGRAPVLEDFWRHTYQAEILPVSDISGVMAAARRADGNTRIFRTDGREFHNDDGGAYRLERLVDGLGATTGWRLTTDASDVELYDALGQLSSITKREGHVHTVARDANGRISTVTDSFGRALAFTYDASGRLSTLTDPASRVYTYGYDAEGRLATVIYPGNVTRTYLYEDEEFPWGFTGIVDERGRRLSTYTYDANGRVASTEHAGQSDRYSFQYNVAFVETRTTTVYDAFGVQGTYEFKSIGGATKPTKDQPGYIGQELRTYDTNGNPLTKTDRRGYVTTFVYDASRNLETSRTEAYGTANARTITTAWHPSFRLPAQVTEPSGVAGVNLVTTYTHDTSGNVTQKLLAAGALTRQWDYTYNAYGQVLTVNGPRTDVTDVTTMTYYPANDTCVGCRGQVQTVTNAAGQVTTFDSYSADSRPTQITDPNGAVTTMTYTARGWLESRTQSGETTSYEYDAVGNLSKVTLPSGAWVSYAYDDASRLVEVHDRLGNYMHYQLDVMGNRVQEDTYDPQNELKRALYRVYDGGNRLFREVGAEGQSTEYAYDSLLVSSVKDPLMRTTASLYDELGRLKKVTNAAAGATWFTYDAKDHLKTVQDPRGLTTTYTYNGLGDLVTQASPDTGNTSFTFDAAGNVATQTDARSVVMTYTYDALNRVLAATVTDGTVTYEYDNVTTGGPGAKGRLTKVTDPSGSTTWAYDLLGRVTSRIQTVGSGGGAKTFTTLYSYTAGLLTGITYPSGRVLTIGYDLQGQAASLSADGVTILSGGLYFPFGGARKWTWGNGEVFERFFDLDGRITGVTQGPSTGAYADLDQTFGYDVLNRLTSAAVSAGQTLGFAYDANGNRTSTNINGSSTTTYTYPGSSHKLSSLSGATSRSFGYDLAGNLTLSAGITYVYDGRGRMKQAGSTTYLVNGLGQRVRKSSGTDMYFVYDEAGKLLGEYDATGAAIQEYVWLGDTPVAIMRPAALSGTNLYYVWADNLGTPRAVSDTSNVLRWEWAQANPFGASAPNENPAGAGAFALNLRFPGQYYDQETGLHYNYFRDYDPAIGRYVQSDPIGLRGGINTYGYVGGSPLAELDNLGLANGGWQPSPGIGNLRPNPFRLDKFTYHGYWCGPGWTGGHQGSYSPDISDYRKPIDGLDHGCQMHDICYYKCRNGFPCDKDSRGKCMTRCDRDLATVASFYGHGPSTSPLWWWMRFNSSPDTGPDAR